MKLLRDPKITQESARFLAQRLHQALAEDGKLFLGAFCENLEGGGSRRLRGSGQFEEP